MSNGSSYYATAGVLSGFSNIKASFSENAGSSFSPILLGLNLFKS